MWSIEGTGSAGVIELPSGRRVRGRRFAKLPADAPPPEFGVYLLGREPDPVSWDYAWVRWPDFWLPTDRLGCIEALRHALDRSAAERVEVACRGGRGRTGGALGILAILDGVDPSEAVRWVRARYDRRAIETPWQRRWLASIEP